jgi:hypothetical protein
VNRNYRHEVIPLWRLWAAREGVDPSRVVMLEDVLTADELKDRGLSAGVEPTVERREAALLAAGKSKKAKL